MQEIAYTALQYFFLAGVPLLALLGIILKKAKQEAEPTCIERADRYLHEQERNKQA